MVKVGALINDIQQLDLQSHSYNVDMYMWFKWRNPDIDPSRSFEFLNAFEVPTSRSPRCFSSPRSPDSLLDEAAQWSFDVLEILPLHHSPPKPYLAKAERTSPT